MVKIRRSKSKSCNSCYTTKAKFYDIGIGSKDNRLVFTLCDGCMHELLQKLIYTGKEH